MILCYKQLILLRIYFYIEKKPLNYADEYEGKIPEISEKQAQKALPESTGINAYRGKNRSVTMSRMYYWAQEFQKLYPNEFKVYFEDENFSKHEILNFDLLDYMLRNASKYDLKLRNVFKQLNNNDYGIEFIKEYIVTKKMNIAFITYFVKYCSEMLDELNQHLSKTYKDKLLNRILIYADINDIENCLGNNQNFIDEVNNCKYFCRILKNRKIGKARKILDKLNIKLIYIDEKEINSELFDTIYKKSCYVINQKNIELLLNKKFGEKVEDIQKQNYTTISKYEEMHKYINSNISIYINNIFFQYDNNTMEDLQSINELLSNEIIDIETKRKIIKKELNLNDIELINDKKFSNDGSDNEVTLWELYLEENKIIPSFSNIIKYYNKYDLDNKLVSYINKNSELLEFDITLDINLHNNFIESIIKNDKINDESFEGITNAISDKYEFDEFDFSVVNKERSSKIFTSSKIDIEVNEDNYNNLRNNHSDLLIKFVEDNIKEFYIIMDNLDYDDVLISDIISSSKIERTILVIAPIYGVDFAFLNSPNVVLYVYPGFLNPSTKKLTANEIETAIPKI